MTLSKALLMMQVPQHRKIEVYKVVKQNMSQFTQAISDWEQNSRPYSDKKIILS